MNEQWINKIIENLIQFPEIYMKKLEKIILKKKPEIYMEIVKQNADAISYVPKEIKEKNPEIYIEAVKQNGDEISYVPKEIKEKNPEIYLEAVKQNGHALKYLPEEIMKKNIDICMEAVKQNGHALKYLPEEIMKKNIDIWMEAVKKNGYALEHVLDEIKKSHPEICMEAVKQAGTLIKYVPAEILETNPAIYMAAAKQTANIKYIPESILKETNPKIWIELVKQNGCALKYVPENIKETNPEIYMEAVKQDGEALKYVPEFTKETNSNIYVEAVKQNFELLRYVPEDVKIANPEICIEAVKKRAYFLEYVPDEIKIANPEICMEAMKQNGYSLQYLPSEMKKANPEICMEAVKQNGYALKYVPYEMKKANPEICMEAMKQNGYALKYVPDEIKETNPEIYIEAVKQNGEVLQEVSNEIKEKKFEICMEAVKQNGNALEYVPDKIKKDNFEICIEAIKQNTNSSIYIPEELIKNNLEFYMELVKQNGYELIGIPENIKSENPEICMEAIKQNGTLIEYVSKKILTLNPNLCVEAVKQDGFLIKYIPNEILKSNLEIFIEAVKEDGYVLEYIKEDLYIENLEICMEAVKQNGNALEYVSYEIMEKNPEICIEAIKQNINALGYTTQRIVDEYYNDIYENINKNMSNNKSLYTAINISKEETLEHIFKNANRSEIIKKIFIKDLYNKLYAEHNYDDYDDYEDYEDYDNNEFPIDKYKKVTAIYDKIGFIPENEAVIMELSEEKIIEYNENKFNRLKENNCFKASQDYREEIEDKLIVKMWNSIGYDETVRLLSDIPNLTEDEIIKLIKENEDVYNKVFEEKYIVKGELALASELFRKLDGMTNSYGLGKKELLDVYKNINKHLEDGNELELENLLRENFLTDSNQKDVLGSCLNTINSKLTNSKLEKLDTNLKLGIEENFTNNQDVIKDILDIKISKMLKENGNINTDDLLRAIDEEILSVRENGTNRYSPHVINQKEEILSFTYNYVMDETNNKILNRTIEDILKSKKEEIGQGWIRKILQVKPELNKEEYEKISNNIGIKIEVAKEIKMKELKRENGLNDEEYIKLSEEFKQEGYKLLNTLENPEILTYNKAEIMFDGLREPYSKEFEKYFVKNKEEIMKTPEYYEKFALIANNFDSIIKDSNTITIYEKGKLSLGNIIEILNEQKYENVRDGEKRLADIASKACLDKEYFSEAQTILKEMKKREYQSIPPVKVEEKDKKYRGRMLRCDDELHILVGNITTCCQSLGEVGEGSMQHSSREANGGVFVVEELNKNGEIGKIITQSWVWRNKDRVCFDNIESKETLTKSEQKEVLEIYEKAGKKAIDTDEKMMTKLLKEKKITQEIYDAVVLKEVTAGLGYNDLEILAQKYENGELEHASIISPKEKEKVYKGINTGTPWVDSGKSQALLAKMQDEKINEIKIRQANNDNQKYNLENIPEGYRKKREIIEAKGKKINTDIVSDIIEMEKTTFTEERRKLQDVKNQEDIAEEYGLNEDKMQLSMSKDKDWYIIYEERENELYIADMAMVNGVNSSKEEKTKTDVISSTYELAEKVYKIMLEMAEIKKNISVNAINDTSYLNINKMEKKGLIEVLENEEDYYVDNVKINNMILKPNKEALEKELKEMQILKEKLEQRQLLNTVKKAEEKELKEIDETQEGR